jgi:hypothetical protein
MSLETFAYDLLAGADVLPPRGQAVFTYDEVKTNLRIQNKDSELIPYVPNRIQRHFAQHRTGRDLVLKPRQVGFSTEIRGDNFARCITSTIRCACVAHEQGTTEKLRMMDKAYHDNLSESMWTPREYDNEKFCSYVQTGSQVNYATAGNGNSGRGGTYNYVHGSEVAYWPNAKNIIDGLLQGVPNNGIVVFESTPNGAQGYFYDACLKAMKGEGRFKFHFYPWWWEDEYRLPLQKGEVLDYTEEEYTLVTKHGLTAEQIKWRRSKDEELGDTRPQEYPEDPSTCFLTSGSSVFTGFQSLLYHPDEQGAMDEHLYVMGIDWSGGGQGDADSHAVSIADATDYREVFLWTTRGRDDDAILAEIVEFVKRWRVIAIVPEFNSMGATLTRRLFKLLNEGGHDWGTNRRGESLEPVVSPVTMTNQTKDELVKDFKAGFKANYKLIDDANGTDELLSFESRQLPSGLWTYGAKSGKHDDTVIARMLCHKACYAHKGY